MSSSTDRIAVGYVRRAHGLRGDVLLRPQSDDPNRFVVGASFLTGESPPRHLEIVEIREHAEGLLLRFAQITDRNQADALRGVTLTVGSDERRELGADEFWPDQLTGLEAVSVHGTSFGTVTGVITGAAQDRLVITTPAATTVEVPFVAAIATAVDVAAGRITLDPPPGLFNN